MAVFPRSILISELVRQLTLGLCCALSLAVALSGVSAQESQNELDSAEPSIAFETHIRPILKQHCFHCHGERGAREGGLDVRLKRLLVEGGDTGGVIEPGDAEASYLIQRVEAGEMPPEIGKQLGDDELQLLRDWVNAGAPTLRDEPEELSGEFLITAEDRQFWSFQPIKRPDTPHVQANDRVRTEIDRFVLAKLEQEGLTFAPDADQRTLIRRVSMDLRGLPPTQNEIDQYLEDPSAGAYESMVDRMLESPQYGEHWGRHWLDVAGYSDSEGTENDQDRTWAFRYRDYVIRSLNQNKPLDQFILEQLAGDELVPRPWHELSAVQIEKLEATGFLRMAADGTAQVNDLEQRNQTIADTIEIVSTGLLGLSVQCARCHDHRYDPISQADYYRLRAVFEPGLNPAEWRTPAQRLISLYTAADREQAEQIETQVRKILADKATKQAEFMAAALDIELQKYAEPLRQELREAFETESAKRSAEQQALLKQYPAVNITPGVLYQYNQKAADELKTFDAQVAELRKSKPVEPFVRAFWEASSNVPTTHVLHRGDPQQPQEAVEPRGLTITGSDQHFQIEADKAGESTGRRTALAKWLCAPEHPLTTRVLANRIWMNHFGQGLVGTPADFGRLGDPPTHPDLLDWLAIELQARQWDLKSMHRLIMQSTVYRQAATPDRTSIASELLVQNKAFATAADIDPANRLYWKWPLRRMSAESLRDAWLMVSGQLNHTQFGPAVDLRQDETGQTLVAAGNGRRSIYVKVKRSQPVAMLQLFDQPVMVTNCPRRANSTAAPQALALMNSPWIQQVADQVVQQVATRPASSDEQEWWTTQQQNHAPTANLEITSPWSVGWGTISGSFDRVEHFEPFTVHNNDRMQVASELPDANTGWVFLSPTGGHPGKGLDHVAIRRWRAPVDGVIRVTGKLTHASDQGDGVRATVIVERSREFVAVGDATKESSTNSQRLGQWNAFHAEQATNVDAIEVSTGDVIDFIVDAKTNEGFDSFQWSFDLTLVDAASGEPKQEVTWNSHEARIVDDVVPVAIQIRRLWPQVLQRPVRGDEFSWASDFVVKQVDMLAQIEGKRSPAQVQRALSHVAQALMTSNEFLYIE